MKCVTGETVEIGMSAAETGHLVMSTLHTVDAGQTINRIVGMFNQEEEQQIRIRLADTLRWVISQRLVPKEGGGRIALLEIMQNTHAGERYDIEWRNRR